MRGDNEQSRDVVIEDPVTDRQEGAKLTLYSCTLKGSSDGRDVFEARLKADQSPSKQE